MKIKLVEGATAYEAAINTLQYVDAKDLTKDNLVVVPDTFSMQAESLLFDVIGTKSVFNAKVVGISKLASSILRKNNIPFQRISGLEEVFVIFKAVKECESSFQYFKKCSVDFCIKILKIIKQFKACKVLPSAIKKVGDQLLDRKMADLRLVYQKYEDLLGERLDLSKMLDFFAKNAENCIDLSNVNLFFVNFDSFSAEISSFICKLAAFVNLTYIGMAKPISVGNAFIYEDDIFEKVKMFSKENSVLVEIENKPTALTGNRLKLVENLFSFDVTKGEDKNYFTNIIAQNRQDEVEFVAKYIKHQVWQGGRFKDFAIAVSDPVYYDKIKEVFSQYDITYYCDDAVNLSHTILGRFLTKLLQIAKLDFDKESLEYLVSHPLTECENKAQILSDIWYFDVEDEIEFEQRFGQLGNIVSEIKNLRKCKKCADFAIILKEIIQIVDEKYLKMIEILHQDDLFKQESENAQAKDLIVAVLDKLAQLGEQDKIDLIDFENLFALSLESVKVETIPSYVDAVYVGDATGSYFEDVSQLIVLGATANALPRTQGDVGIIDDADIEKLRLNFRLEPEIKVLNRRSRLKLFECLQHAKDRLIVCQPAAEDGQISQQASFVEDLKLMFGNNVAHTVVFERIETPTLTKEEMLSKLLRYLGNKTNLTNAYTKLKATDNMPKNFAGELAHLAENSVTKPVEFETLPKEIANKAAFAKGTVSASRLEKYFDCPFNHFVNYILGVKQKNNIQPTKLLFGNFQHELIEKFVADNNFDVSKVDAKGIERFLDENFMTIAKKHYDEKIISKKSFLAYLKNESVIILRSVSYEQSNSNFRPAKLEEFVGGPIANEVKLVGRVDRIDVCDNYFRILDYKTGNVGSVLKDLYYGNKLQLFLYGKEAQRKLGKDCAGLYYFKCNTNYKSQSAKNENLFRGLTKKDNDVVENSDRRLLDEGSKSDIIGMARKKDDGKQTFSFKYGSPVEDFDVLFDYATKVSQGAIEEIKQGYIKDKPYEGKCEGCPYGAICKHNPLSGYRILQKVEKIELGE